MSTNSKIEWTDATWNIVIGCTKVSAGCDHCYAVPTTARNLTQLRVTAKSDKARSTLAAHEKAIRYRNDGSPRWTGKVGLIPEKLSDPFGWKSPKRIFVNSKSDLFHEDVPFEFIDKVFAVMALTPQHTYQVLTKRPERMAEYLDDPELEERLEYWIEDVAMEHCDPLARRAGDLRSIAHTHEWPLPNVWLGTSVENQKTADERIPHLLKCPAAVRFLSMEPLLGAVYLGRAGAMELFRPGYEDNEPVNLNEDFPQLEARFNGIHWVIVGGESGPGARPMHPDWARSIRDQCAAAGVPFFFKQWGDYMPCNAAPSITDPKKVHHFGDGTQAIRVGKKAAGRLLDGVEHNAMPADLRVREMPGVQDA